MSSPVIDCGSDTTEVGRNGEFQIVFKKILTTCKSNAVRMSPCDNATATNLHAVKVSEKNDQGQHEST